MPHSSNQRLPSPPGTTIGVAQEQHYIVSPLDEAQHPLDRRANHEARNNPRNDNHKLISSVSEGSLCSTKWQPPTTSRPKSGSHWWLWEWLCELLAVGSLGAMVFTLWYYHDKPQSEWRQSYFTLNGLIAFLATLIKTGLIVPVSAAIGQRKWLRFIPSRASARRARRLGDFETFDEASRGSVGSIKLMFTLDAW